MEGTARLQNRRAIFFARVGVCVTPLSESRSARTSTPWPRASRPLSLCPLLFQVGPPVQTGARFSRGFLRGLSLWLDGAAPCASGGAQISAAVANLSLNGHVDGQSSAATATGANDSRVRLSVRLELMELTDQEVRLGQTLRHSPS